jgi:RNA polymerase sigma-70 factor (ECF subfamily)
MFRAAPAAREERRVAVKADFIRLFMPLQGNLMAYVLSMGVPPEDADDVLQTAALHLFHKIESFQEGTNFRAWAYAFVKNEVLRHFKSKTRRSLTLSEEALREIEDLSFAEAAVPDVRIHRLNSCLQKLQEFARTLLALRYREGLGVQAIAERLRRPVDSIYTTLSRVRKALQDCLSRSAAGETP